jgi:hypothetical protein
LPRSARAGSLMSPDNLVAVSTVASPDDDFEIKMLAFPASRDAENAKGQRYKVRFKSGGINPPLQRKADSSSSRLNGIGTSRNDN